jgi:glycosyltransferase involved in cell wall biosynthesis
MGDLRPADTPGRQLRVLQLETFGRGGLMHYAHNLAGALAARGHEVTLVTAEGYELEGTELPPGMKVVPFLSKATRRSEGRLPGSALAAIRKVEALIDVGRFAQLIRRLRPDVVHLHSTNQIALAYLIALRSLGLPVVVTAHVVTAHERSPFLDAVHRRIHRLSPRIIAHSNVDRGRLIEEMAVDPDRVRVVPHGEYGFFARTAVDLDRTVARRSFGLAADDEVALFFGYIREYKGVDVLLDAWSTVTAARPRARLVVAGDPVQLSPARRAELEEAAARAGAVSHFAYVPFAEVGRYFAAADVLVLPYRAVSQSGVLFLALALGVPIVATRVGALPEVLGDGDSGLLVEPGSSEALASALVRMLGDADLRARFSRAGRRTAERYSWPSIAGQTEAVYAELLPPGQGTL